MTGSFYSPSNLSSYVASKMFPLLPKKRLLTILDPAVGDGALLFAFQPLVKVQNVLFVGVDINDEAVENTSLRMIRQELRSHIFYTDALSPYNLDIHKGWNRIKERLHIKSFDAIISNPPWGAEFDSSSVDSLSTAIGQYDIYDLFLEISIDLLSDGGVYGFIIPDSIYRKEHYAIRKKLLSETSVKFIARIGEFIFDGVNTSVSVIVGTKCKPSKNSVCNCVHFPNSVTKRIASNQLSFFEAEKGLAHSCKQQFFIDSDFALTIDITQSDVSIFSFLDSFPHLNQFIQSQRGVELSKKGNVIRCPNCLKWMPIPKKKDGLLKCSHCQNGFSLENISSEAIISSCFPDNIDAPKFLAGEDLGRYTYRSKSHILLNYDGINYKDSDLYRQPKILVRKTGVGITAVLDYDNHYVNQVVYVLTRKNIAIHIPLEFFIAAINSRITTYYIIKKFGSANWCTHPYLSQSMVGELPMPNFSDFSEGNWESVRKITSLVEMVCKENHISNDVDIEIEKELVGLYNIPKDAFLDMISTIESVEQLVPFKRLLYIPKEVWATVI